MPRVLFLEGCADGEIRVLRDPLYSGDTYNVPLRVPLGPLEPIDPVSLTITIHRYRLQRVHNSQYDYLALFVG